MTIPIKNNSHSLPTILFQNLWQLQGSLFFYHRPNTPKNASLKQRGSRGLIRAQFSPTQIGRLKKQPQVRQATERGANGVFGGHIFFLLTPSCGFLAHIKYQHLKLKVITKIEISKSYSVFPTKKKRHILACTAFFSLGFRDLNAIYTLFELQSHGRYVSHKTPAGRSSAFVLRMAGSPS